MTHKVSTAACPMLAEVDRAYTLRQPERVSDHLRECAACSAYARSMLHSVQALQRSTPLRLSEQDKDMLRARLLVSARTAPNTHSERVTGTRHWTLAALLTGAALLALYRGDSRAAVAAPVRAPVARYRASIRALGAARFTRISAQPDEKVRLYEGSISVEVEPLAPGERFRVITADGEVEVHGTRFDVSAEHERLMRVSVDHGSVSVRYADEPRRMLYPQTTWVPQPHSREPARPAQTAAPAQAPASEVASIPSPASGQPGLQAQRPKRRPAAQRKPPAAPAQPTASEIAFQAGWTALRSGDATAASRSFLQVALDSPLGQDAAFWNGIALGRAGDNCGAAQALERFVLTYPRSPLRAQALAARSRSLQSVGSPSSVERGCRSVREPDPPLQR